MTMPITAGMLAKPASRNAPVWFVIALIYAMHRRLGLAQLDPWDVCT